MAQSDKQNRETQAQQRLQQMSEASQRISGSLDFDTVLQEIIDSARSLTNARHGAITVPGKAGEPTAVVLSGLNWDDQWDGSEAASLFDYLSGLEKPLRVADVDDFLTSLAIPDFRPAVAATSMLVLPIRHGGVNVGTIYVSHWVGHDEQAREFTSEDEEILAMFAAQAALVIANSRQYRSAQRARSDLAALVDISPVGIVVLDAKTATPVSINREAIRMFDSLRDPEMSPEQLLDVLICRRADGQELPLENSSLIELLGASGMAYAEEVSLLVPDGRSVTALVNAAPIRSESGDIESFVVTLQDTAPLEQMERMRAEFLGMVSHELRAPLATIKGSVATLLESAPELDLAEMTGFFGMIRDQCDNMRELIGGLLDVARIETGSLLVVPEPCDLYLLVDEAKSRFLGSNGQGDLRIELESDLPLVIADRGRTVQVLANLLSNAAKHSPGGSVIEVQAMLGDSHVAVTVLDQGRGIAADLLPHLFRKFSRTEGSGGKGSIPGSGLGLAICKGIVEAQGGRIWAESDGLGRGARFSFTIPTIEESAASSVFSSSSRGTRRPDAAPECILAVDDDPDALRYIRDALVKTGYAPVVTGNPKDVPHLLDAENPDLVLLDLMLPQTDGIELMQDIQTAADVPVIFLSIYGQDDVIANALDMGAADYMVKPFSQTELAARIRAALRRRAGPADTVSVRELSINHAERRVNLAEQPVALTPTEYSLLYELAVNAGRVLTHDVLLRRVWGPERIGEPWLVREVVKRLRRKLSDAADDPTYILTESGVGYRMAAEAPESDDTDGDPDDSADGVAERDTD
ncbi:MAG: response regulator [Acidimicrobiales bacterium]|nr:response regulator [Acidimicrobiales bacterium]MYD81807.1 response regulator [Acidimicrobiales bacterium]MYJ63905.1 response regulator [Acidimicrobiales bacterium]